MYKQLNGFREITRNIKVEQYQVKFTTLRSLILPNGNAAIKEMKKLSRMESIVTSSLPIKCLIVVYSYHHNNTARIAQTFSGVLNAQIKTPDQVAQEEIQQYDLIGFGSGIDSGKHYGPILDFVDRIPKVNNQRCFIFSTSAIQGVAKVEKDHSLLRDKLTSKGFIIVDEFSCKGFNTNSFLKYFGGMNKGRPNSEDLMHAEAFAFGMAQKGIPYGTSS